MAHVLSQDIVKEAHSWLGVKWRHQGRSKMGVDCAGLVYCVGVNVGINLQDYTGYPNSPNVTFLKYFDQNGYKIGMRDLAPGDLVVFSDQRHPCHCGIMVQDRRIIHAHISFRRVIIQPLKDAVKWSGKVKHVFRYPNANGAK